MKSKGLTRAEQDLLERAQREGWQIREAGAITGGTGVVLPVEPPKGKAKLVEEAFTPPNLWTIPLATYAGDNLSGSDAKKRFGRAGNERRVTSRVLGKQPAVLAEFWQAIHAGRALVVTFTRLGGRGLDKDDNLNASFKYVRDTVALMAGVDDNDSRWNWRYKQKPGGSFGVQIRIELFPE